jgi:Raf kinase inhibitor-like YbhB/YbcL family protein
LTSTAFGPAAPIPAKYAGCAGQDVSPPLSWNDPPPGTVTLALIIHDPDAPVAGGWTHWVLFDMTAQQRSLAEAVPHSAQLAAGGTHGNNSWDRLGYGGPCPPVGDPAHTYRFTLYAVDRQLGLATSSTRAQVLAALQGRTLGEALLTGTYRRP